MGWSVLKMNLQLSKNPTAHGYRNAKPETTEPTNLTTSRT